MLAILRFIAFVFITLWYLTPILIRAAIKGSDLKFALEYRRRWARRATPMLGMRLRERGIPAYSDTCIFIGNHRSYTDPVIALREIKALPVAKAEVSKWPLIGFAARATGIMFVKRESRKSRHSTLDAMLESLQDGFPVLIYPEGTTHVDPQTAPFRKGAFGLAARHGYPIVPIAIDYGKTGDAWVGDDQFVPHFFRTFGKWKTDVWIEYGPPMRGDNANDLSQQAKVWLDQKLAGFKAEREENASVSG
ncbi:MAG: 1-acyl-sn-glycerol-3-phosphate acyltransferase [Bacteroidetes bacterium]|nr:1-acyl-sn-glycerol-3-phosphate acyltransferase [Bacteroidota bacterium]